MSGPSLSWDGKFKLAKIELELISDPDMFIFFEKGIKGGISYISDRYSKANNKYLKSYDPKQESKNIIYLEAIVYMAMQCLNFFQQVDLNGYPKKFNLNKYTSNSSKGCVLEVDLEYPKELWNLHNDYPLAPNKIEIKREMLSDYQLKIDDLYNIHIGNAKKLVPNIF